MWGVLLIVVVVVVVVVVDVVVWLFVDVDVDVVCVIVVGLFVGVVVVVIVVCVVVWCVQHHTPHGPSGPSFYPPLLFFSCCHQWHMLVHVSPYFHPQASSY